VPYIIRPRQVHKVAAGFAVSLLLVLAAPSLAHAACPVASTSQAFAKFGDTANYTLVDGGLFESVTPGWSLGGASLSSDNPETQSSSYDFGDGGGEQTGITHSLLIPSGVTVVSPAFCVDSQYPSFRFLLRRVYGYNATLDVSLRWSDSYGTHETADASLNPGRSWELTPVLQLSSKLPAGVTPNTRLVFTANRGWFAIADVYIDPYRR
jgi:hypothetical protein